MGGTMKHPACMPATGTHGIANWRDLAQHVGHLDEHPADLFRIDIRDDESSIFSVIAFGVSARCSFLWIHGFTVWTVETNPFLVKVKFCLYSPRLIL
jgi:hypothetical protein